MWPYVKRKGSAQTIGLLGSNVETNLEGLVYDYMYSLKEFIDANVKTGNTLSKDYEIYFFSINVWIKDFQKHDL